MFIELLVIIPVAVLAIGVVTVFVIDRRSLYQYRYRINHHPKPEREERCPCDDDHV